ncbi:ABC transporter permease [Sphingomonas sanguinis]|jgi:ABC-2 type transport system permease protein|uniref:Transport permease protein n=1 Tax=Sphingomonas sanguinis TaxID=33051 RepID=A0A147JCN1_9SPHN|nr:ABC transporter permease [Sphingomonas sanguinis]KTT65237.1 sugar ABC transporter permease [Sphingomonas sanguinis]KTW02917.1 sugar ABC transporter permease [Sphingomonas sanguinis]KTW17707.1 sugar ABC transporter permease [Sphingomonas sanguinis]MBZ6383283.1 ABC transporter permease [Sphingomonas sanguinis]NNG49947.1 ABC transporter permease [Sphingomonas sanguinis]
MNLHGIWSIYRFEMARFRRTVWTSLMVPVITTTLYFVVFGTAIGSAMNQVSGVPYGAFIVPGLMLLSIFSESILNASLGIYMPKFTGTMYEILSAPLSPIETVLGYVGAAASKSMVIGLVILATAYLFVDLSILHPVAMVFYLLLVATTFSLFGFAIGIWARGFEQLQVIPLLIVTPLTFLGGAFYSVKILPEPWRTVTLFNPVVYLINGFRWTFFGTSDVTPGVSLGVTALFLLACLAWIGWIFRTGWRLKN